MQCSVGVEEEMEYYLAECVVFAIVGHTWFMGFMVNAFPW